MKITFTEASWSDYIWLQENDKRLLKRRDLIAHLEKFACYLIRHGGKHAYAFICEQINL